MQDAGCMQNTGGSRYMSYILGRTHGWLTDFSKRFAFVQGIVCLQRFVKNLDEPYPEACELSLYSDMQMEPLAMAPTPTSLLTAVRGLRLGGLLGGYQLVHEKISDLPGRINQVGTDLPPKKIKNKNIYIYEATTAACPLQHAFSHILITIIFGGVPRLLVQKPGCCLAKCF